MTVKTSSPPADTMDGTSTRGRTATLLLLLSAGTVGIVLTILALSGKRGDVYQVLVIIAGMAAAASISPFQLLLRPGSASSRSRKPAALRFDERAAAEIIEAADYAEPVQPRWDAQPWELSFPQLVAMDCSLALAKLRIEIEQELRRIAFNSCIDIRGRPIGARGLVEQLSRRR